MVKVFISYSSADEGFARRLADDLKEAGAEVWIAANDLDVSDNLVVEIQRGLTAADFVCVLISAAAMRSAWVREEVSSSLHRSIQGGRPVVLPLLLESCEVPPLLDSRIYLDCRAPADYGEQLRRIRARLGLTSGGRPVVAVDSSFRQDEWHGRPTLRAGYKAMRAALGETCHLLEIQGGYAAPDVLSEVAVLVLPMPYGTIVDAVQYETIEDWVRRGGGLLLLGTYLMERHHHSNLHVLANSFGLRFAHDLLMPVDQSGVEDPSAQYSLNGLSQAFEWQERKYWTVGSPVSDPLGHPVFEGVSTVGFTSSCSVTAVTGRQVVGSLAEPVAGLYGKGEANTEGKLHRVTGYGLASTSTAPFLAGVCYGKGSVIGMGSWKILLNEFLENPRLGNARLLQNTVHWLGKAGSHRSDVA